MKTKAIATAIQEVYEIEGLNIELLETLNTIGKKFFDYVNEHKIPIQMQSLLHLIERADAIMEEIGGPCSRNPIISDERYHNNSNNSSDDKETEPLAWVLLSYDKSEALR